VATAAFVFGEQFFSINGAAVGEWGGLRGAGAQDEQK
jgi:hypothetical protein